MKLENTIYCGDNLDILRKFPDNCVDLVYIDPPFFSNKHYEVIFNDGEEIRSFQDRWKGGIEHYIGWMKERVFEFHRVLNSTGSFYLHCDWHASHYLKVMCDGVFGYKNFQNEIIWHYQTGGASGVRFSRKHDIILWFTKSNEWQFHGDRIAIPRTEKSMKRAQNPMGARISATDTMKNPDDVFDIQQMNPMAKERLGYPTQKPEALLERIIKASTNEGDTVLDAFCGCGTTLAVAQKLNRRWMGMDVSPTACKLIQRRLSALDVKDVEIIGLPRSIEELKQLEPFEFQNWIIGVMGGTVSVKKTGDMGIDGYTWWDRNPIQVKQSEHIGRNVVDNFETALERNKKNKGIIVGFSFTRGAHEEVARAKQEKKMDIILRTVSDVVQKF